MSERVELRDLAGGIRRRLWIPVLCTLIGVLIGFAAAMNMTPVYRSQATVLVGPTDGSVTHSATVRTSESLAAFYADMARRQIVLGPVVDQLRLDTPWGILRNQVSAVVPPQNLRLVTVTVMGDDQQMTNEIANEVVTRLVALSPTLSGGNKQAFINDQADTLKDQIEAGQDRTRLLESEIAQTTDPVLLEDLDRRLRRQQRLVDDSQQTYVEFIAAEPTSDAGGLQVIDEATNVTDMGRSGLYQQAVVGGFVGGVIGLLIAWMLHSRENRRRRRVRHGPLVVTAAPLPRSTPEPTDEEDGDSEERVLAGAVQRRGTRTKPGGRSAGDVSRGDWG